MQMDFDEMEIKILEALKKLKKEVSLKEISSILNEKEDTILKNLYFLQNKDLLKIKEKRKKKLFLDLKEEKFPEELLFELLKKYKKISLKELKEKGIEGLNVALGELKKEGVIEIKDGFVTLLKEEYKPKIREFIRKFEKSNLSEEEKNYLRKRKILKEKEVVEFFVEPKEELFNLDLSKIGKKYNRLTKELIKTGEWKNLKKFDVKAYVEPIYGGRKNHLSLFIDKIRNIWLSMGFKEAKSDYIVNSLINFDVLLVPHDHLAREAQDTFYLEVESEYYKKEMEEMEKYLLKKTEEVHRRLYGYFDEKESKKFLLRTHDTVVSALILLQFLKERKERVKGKFFSIGKVFRNETVDRTHLAEFYQSEGLVIGENLKIEHLKWYLKEFFLRLGFKEIKFKIAYFPFTEPSLEVFVYHEKLGKFIELGGAGIFRKEINEIFGISKDYNILAWGLGIERLAMIHYGIDDIRKLEGNKTSIELIRNYEI